MRIASILAARLIAALLVVGRLGAQSDPPPVPREFRAVWVATVGNIDWPSRPGLSSWEQQRELLAILDRCVALGVNAVIFQVRPGADALYASPFEPWSEFITGRQGRAPDPPWDPLAFAVEQAHRRGIELHAWFNPYRARYARDTTAVARTHVAIANPELVRPYGPYLWMDPGDPEVRRRSLRAIVDVVKRYDVDGVHIDDYFYPYPETDSAKRPIDFPDSLTYARYRNSGGKLAKDDWRRDNVDRLVESLYGAVHAAKPWVRVGISPFGIWRPGNPPQIKGFDSYTQIYADSRKWLVNGWVDYIAPQLYWPIKPPDQSFPVLYDWWASQNTKHRHLWPGLATYRVTENSARHIASREIIDEIDSVRVRTTDAGHIHFNMTALMRNPDSLDDRLAARYVTPALVAASPWLGAAIPGKPTASLSRDAATGDGIITFAPAGKQAVWLWTVRSRAAGAWKTEILGGWLRSHRLLDANVDRVVITAVSRTGVEGPAVTVEKR